MQDNYQIMFPIIEKTEVLGDKAHPMYKNLKEQLPESEITDNFAKYLIDATGKAVKFFDSRIYFAEVMNELNSLCDAC